MYFSKRTPAFAYANRVNPPLPVFSFEIPKAGAMRFLVCSYDKFVDMYVSTRVDRRFYHEISVEDRPVKLFFDIDKSLDKSKDKSLDKSDDKSKDKSLDKSLDKSKDNTLSKYVVGVVDGLVSSMLGSSYLEPICLDASDSTKMSIHLIYPVYFRDKSILIEFIDELMSKMTDDMVRGCVDRGVYGRNHSLRLIGSRKRRSERVLVGASFSRDYILRSLLHYIGDGTRLVESWGVSEVVRTGRVRDDSSSATMDRWNPNILKVVSTRVHEHYVKKYRRSGMSFTWIGRSMCINLRPGLVCPIIGRVHRSNSSCIVVTFPDVCTVPLHLHVTVRCMDSECNRAIMNRQVLIINFD